MRQGNFIFGVVLLLTTITLPVRGQEKTPESLNKDQLERLGKLCRVWGAVRFQHPYLAYHEIDWDGALVRVLADVEAAKTNDEFAAAVQSMLDVLDDPVTRVARREAAAPEAIPTVSDRSDKPPPDKWFTRLADDTLAIDVASLPNVSRIRGTVPQLVELGAEINKARGLVLDFRRVSVANPGLEVVILSLACTREIRSIGSRRIVHSGYKAQRGSIYESYYSAFEIGFSPVFSPRPQQKSPKSVWLFDEQSRVPDIALALQSAGDGFIVVQGKPSEDMVVPQGRIPLVGEYEVWMRTAERMMPDGQAYSFQADAEVAPDGELGFDGPAFKAALGLLKDPKVSQRGERTAQPLPPATWRPDNEYADMSYPDRAHRMLAFCRFWNVIHYFYPYKHLLDRPWDAVLPEFLEKLLTARDEREYELAVLEMATRTQDGHTVVLRGSQNLLDRFGEASPPIELRWIEGTPVVTRLLDERVAPGANIQIGDVVVQVDGEPAGERIERLGKHVSASTPQAHKRSILRRLLYGPAAAKCKLSLRGADGSQRDVEIPRRTVAGPILPPPPSKYGVFEVLPDNVGYVDLTRLEIAQIDPMLEKLRDTKGIIFDMRGYPRGVFGLLAPRLNINNAKYAASFQRPAVHGGEVEEDEEFNHGFLQRILPTDKWKYQGKSVMLIDERAQSQAEHTGLHLEAACNATFIGSHTAGANGDITNMFLPGGLRVMFGGHDVRHADGQQLQRVGLVPHIEIKPTIAGIRAGQDEVLDRAIKFLNDGK